MGADLAGQRQLLLGDVQGDHPGRAQGAKDLDADVAEAAHPEDDGGAAGDQLGQRALDRVVGRQPGVGQRHIPDGVKVAERDEVTPVVHQQVLGDRAGSAEAGREDAEPGCAQAVVLLALGALGAEPAAPRAVHGDRVTQLPSGDAGPEGGHGARALVARVSQSVPDSIAA